MASGFQVQILKANEKCEHHVLVDVSLVLNEDSQGDFDPNYKFLLTLWIYDIKSFQMMPLGQALAQEFSESSIEYILKWFKKQFTVFLKPKSFNVNAQDAANTLKISKILIKVFENVPV